MINKLLTKFGYALVKASMLGSRGWNTLTGGFGTTSKEKVTNDSALTVSTVFACIRNVSEDIAKMPLKVMRQVGSYKYEQSDHRLHKLLKYQPNPEMTAISFRETLNAQAMGWGNAYAEIERDLNGNVLYLWPLRPDKIHVMRDSSNKLYYRVFSENGQYSDIWAKDILHLHGLGFNGVVGYNIIEYAAQSIGGAIGMDKYAGSYFANGMHQSGTLKHPGTLTKDAQNRLRQQMEDEYSGSTKAHRLLVLEEGMEFVPNVIDPKSSQMIETRQFNVAEFCRWLRVPPHKVADLTRATFSNIEEQNIDYVQDGLLGWIERWEQCLWHKLFTSAEKQQGYYFQHVVEGLLRGNIKARYEAYAQMWDRGVLGINEIRKLENLNPVEGGDVHFVPLNFRELNDNSLAESTMRDVSQRLASREIKGLSSRVKYAQKDIVRFKEWLQEFYAKHHEYLKDAVKPLGVEDNIETMSLKPFIEHSSDPVTVIKLQGQLHENYIYSNLRQSYEKRYKV